MTSAATWDLPRIEGLREGSISERRYRERTEAFRALAHVVDEHWYDLSYPARQRLVEYTERFDLDYQPRTFREWFDLVWLPFSFLKTYLTGEHYVSQYILAMAEFIASVRIRQRKELNASEQAWDKISRDDPEFVQAETEGVAALGRREYVRVGWTDLKPNTH